MDLANAEVDEQNVNHLLDRMYRSARLENKEELTFEDFNNMLGDEREHLNYAFLDIGGNGIRTICTKYFCAETVFIHQNLTSVDVRFWPTKTIPPPEQVKYL